MIIALAYYADKNENFINLVKGIEKGIIEQGHQVTIINMKEYGGTLTIYKYIILGCNCTSAFGGRIPEKLIYKIKNFGMLSGKYCSAFVDKKFGDSKTLTNLMKSLEKEGMIVCSSQILTSNDHAYSYAKNLHIYTTTK
jgi:hypothetical protein